MIPTVNHRERIKRISTNSTITLQNHSIGLDTTTNFVDCYDVKNAIESSFQMSCTFTLKEYLRVERNRNYVVALANKLHIAEKDAKIIVNEHLICRNVSGHIEYMHVLLMLSFVSWMESDIAVELFETNYVVLRYVAEYDTQFTSLLATSALEKSQKKLLTAKEEIKQLKNTLKVLTDENNKLRQDLMKNQTTVGINDQQERKDNTWKSSEEFLEWLTNQNLSAREKPALVSPPHRQEAQEDDDWEAINAPYVRTDQDSPIQQSEQELLDIVVPQRQKKGDLITFTEDDQEKDEEDALPLQPLKQWTLPEACLDTCYSLYYASHEENEKARLQQEWKRQLELQAQPKAYEIPKPMAPVPAPEPKMRSTPVYNPAMVPTRPLPAWLQTPTNPQDAGLLSLPKKALETKKEFQ